MSGDASSSSASYDAAARVIARLVEIEKSYKEAGGSSTISMEEIRAQFVEVIPFHSKNWYRHWSNFAIKLVKHDKDAGHPVFKNHLPMPTTTPRSNNDRVYIFNPSDNPEYPPDLSRPMSPSGEVPTGISTSTNNNQVEPTVLTDKEKIARLSRQNYETQSRLNSLLSLHESNEKGKRKKHHKKDDTSDSSSDSSTKSEKNAKKYAFISKKKVTDKPTAHFTPGALLFAADVKGYDTSIVQAVKYFNNSAKPPDFPEVLTKELLLGKFIDIRRIKGELLNPKKGDTTYTASGREKGLEVLKNLTQEISELAEWLYYFGILKRAIKAAFPDCETYISKYGKYIKSQFWLAGIMANWKNIAGYDAAFRAQVANRKYISFADWDHKDCEVLKTQFFGSAYYQQSFGSSVPFSHVASITKGNDQTLVPVTQHKHRNRLIQINIILGLSTVGNFQLRTLLLPLKHMNNSVLVGIRKVFVQWVLRVNGFTFVTSGDVIRNILDVITPEEYALEQYLRGYQWDSTSPKGYSAAIESSLTADPFPDPPSLEIDEDTAFILKQYDIYSKSKLLIMEGFWPTSSLPTSEISDIPNHKSCLEHQAWLEDQCEGEIIKGRYSEEFTTLLPGMNVIPLLMVSKKNSKKMRVCTNMSFGNPSPNDLVDKNKIRVSYDSLKSFAPYFMEEKRKHGKVTVFKSDVEGAFRTLPAHPQYQIRQVLRIRQGGKCRCDHNLTFGHSDSPHICMMDDVWGVADAKDWITFKDHKIPGPQAKLLTVFDILGVPWVWKKQLHAGSRWR
ncbi:uncharacterized protein MELLADRAFT_91363 [Melampsora larici-populina 98AG31]|uniref:Uncharacterized protein n=1 Tax=Melampsora larici-populina (strain 98AG31 / pathotype 3-4-7) TaxID=747676 RepID=F4SEI2_MELLP|nr:uncharacterized protein MELLADRAFT_91363 [Melampsora larici-populina 98AG31]EGF96944.1 hypothetical protein MELLADRAFT_91363 [Melampsora larici-populina 98AG31]